MSQTPGSGKKSDLNIDSIAPPSVASSVESELIDTIEKQALDGALTLDLLKKQLEIQEQIQGIQGRSDWGPRIFWILVAWLVVVVVYVGLQGRRIFTLSDTAIASFLGSATANVLGLGYLVARYFFRQPK
jgi:hypothetical protein